MYPLMVCGQTPVEGTFIAGANYKHLVDRIPRLAQNDWLHRRVRLAANGAVAVALDQYWTVSGFARPDGSAALIDNVAPTGRQPAPPAAHGDFEAVLVNADGQTLSTQHFALESPPVATEDDAVRGFRVLLPQRAQAKTIVIRHGGETIQRYARSAHPPTLSALTAKPDANGGVKVSWQGQDRDDDKLAYDVYYAANGTNFHPRAVGLRADHFTLSPEDRFPGADPQLRVVASDGFDQTSETIALADQGAFSVLSTLPVDADASPRSSRIEASFNADLAPDAITDDTFILEGADGRRVEATLEYRRADYTAILTPEQALMPGTRYTATLSADIADRYGNTLDKPVTWQFTSPIPPREDPASYAEAEAEGENEGEADTSIDNEGPQGQGWLELAGKRRDFEIVECRQTKNDTSGYEVYVRGSGVDGLGVTARIHAWPDKLPTQQVVIHDTPTMYQLSVRETEQGWTQNNGEDIDGPLINVSNGRLTVDADLEINMGGEGRKHVRIEAACPALATTIDK